MEKYMKLAYKEAIKGYKKNEVPVGCVIVRNGKVIAKSHNQKESKNKVINHAEIIAINKANKKLKNWRLNDCIMYVTLEPCMMCTGAIIQSRISKVIYAVESKNFGYLNQIKNKNIIIESKYLKSECENLMIKFFKNKRN